MDTASSGGPKMLQVLTGVVDSMETILMMIAYIAGARKRETLSKNVFQGKTIVTSGSLGLTD